MIAGLLSFLILYFSSILVFGYRCDRRPYGATTQSTASDGRFRLNVVGAEGVYIPEQLYVGKFIQLINDKCKQISIYKDV